MEVNLEDEVMADALCVGQLAQDAVLRVHRQTANSKLRVKSEVVELVREAIHVYKCVSGEVVDERLKLYSVCDERVIQIEADGGYLVEIEVVISVDLLVGYV